MRIKITFHNKNGTTFLPINTNYYIVSLINNLTYEYYTYLNSLVNSTDCYKKFDFYTFSQLLIPQRIINNNMIGIASEDFYLFISSPYYQFLSILTKELQNRPKVRLYQEKFEVTDIDFFPAPEFKENEVRFTCLSPVAVYKGRMEKRNRASVKYVLPNEREYNKYLEKDLLYKYNIVNSSQRDHIDFVLNFDADYIRRKKNKITKVITLENGRHDRTQVRGVLAPLKITAEPEILQLIYDAGLGRMNHFGFGMVETIPGSKVA